MTSGWASARRRRTVDAFPRRPLVADEDPAAREPIALTVHGISEAEPGPRWQALFAATWPGYRRWYLQRDVRHRPDLRTAQSRLAQYMPELVPTYEALLDLALASPPAARAAEATAGAIASPSDDDVAARLLTLWDPPRFLPGCSQAVVFAPDPVLCRNYDYAPALWERVVYASRFRGRRVIGNNDCLWGLLDGMNEDGLVVSLSFGGRRGSGAGFAVSLVVRYLLEVASSVPEAIDILRRVPVAMAYNLTMVDAARRAVTVYVGPDRPPEVSDSPIATNHRGEIPDDERHAHRFASVQRRTCLTELLGAEPDVDELVAAFLRPPLHSTHYRRAFGTVYTALYRPAKRTLTLHWPDRHWTRTYEDPDDALDIVLQPS